MANKPEASRAWRYAGKTAARRNRAEYKRAIARTNRRKLRQLRQGNPEDFRDARPNERDVV